MLSGRKIILGVTGSIAAYKAAYLVRLFVSAGAEVRVVSTAGAQQFVTDLTFSNLSKQPVFSGLWDGHWTEHVHLAEWADVMVIAPATANSLAKFTSGICDNALTAVYLSAKCPVFVAPAMDAEMFAHPTTSENLGKLKKIGVRIIEPAEGEMASGLYGKGRMAEPDVIFEEISAFLSDGKLKGRKVLITAGPTREALDPVRYISNHSSGKMGFALAKTARDMGAEVTLVLGPVSLSPPDGIKVVDVTSASAMHEVVMQRMEDQDILIMSAAVCDYAPADISASKLKKSGEKMSLELIQTPDILAEAGKRKLPGQVLVGFALETDDEEANARSKLERKQCDLLVLNSLRDSGAGFGTDTNKISILDKNGEVYRYPLGLKIDLAQDIFDKILQKLDEKTHQSA